MSEVSCAHASRIIGKSDETIRRHVKNGLLPARREGPRKDIRIDVEELRNYAKKYQYRFNDDLAVQLAK